jgi:GSH-dependent disulfide-bond oxidoreductase
MIDLYAMGSPNVVKIYVALEEMGLPYTVHPVDVFGEDQFKPEFLKLNPNAKVPVIADHDGPGGKPYTLFESGAILLYFAEKTGQFLPKDPVARFDAIQWMMVQMTLVGPMFGQYVHFLRFAPEGNDYSLDRYRTQVRRVLATLEQRLGVVPFLGGQSYSIADIATFPSGRDPRHQLGVFGFGGLAEEGSDPARPSTADRRWPARWRRSTRSGQRRRPSTRPARGPKTASSVGAGTRRSAAA